MSIVAYVETFDPITLEHLDVIVQAAKAFDEVVVVVPICGHYRFSAVERMRMIKRAVRGLPNVVVEMFPVDNSLRFFYYLNELGVEIISSESTAKSSDSFMRNHYGKTGWVDELGKYVPESIRDRLQYAYARKIWRAHVGGKEPFAFPMVAKIYCSGQRHYHDLAHVIRVYDELVDFFCYAQLANSGYLFRLAAIAALFHDCYIESDDDGHGGRIGGKAQDASFEMLYQNYRDDAGLSNRDCDLIREMILATGHAADGVLSLHAGVVADADLAILGQSLEVYDRYIKGIRKEYGFVSDAEFRAGRIKVVQGFLDRGRIYTYGFFYGKYERMARANLARELRGLVGD